MRPSRLATLVASIVTLTACGRTREASPTARTPERRPDLLLVTLDTTRADRVAPEAALDGTPHLGALAGRGVRFTHAYSTAPTTLPAHVSMMTGLYPAGHGVHENGRRLRDDVPVLAAELHELGYTTAAFVSGYPLEGQFGLARGFDHYDDDWEAGRSERHAAATNQRALSWLAARPRDRPVFLWVHYYDPHEPYAPPEPFRSRFAADPYAGEIAAVDDAFGRLLAQFESGPAGTDVRVAVVADHGESLGEHGEATHGNLLYQGVTRVPLLLAGGTIAPGVREDAVSIRQVRATFLGWAGGDSTGGLLTPAAEPVLAEAMQPYLNYRWQPQTMATDGRWKLIRSGSLELYDLAADPGEAANRIPAATPPRELAQAVADYPLPATGASPGQTAPIDDEQRRQLASLGYLTSEGAPVAVPADAPRAVDRAALFGTLDAASRAFARGDYATAAPLLREILDEDPANLMTAVRLAVSLSFLGRDREALAGFAAAARIDPDSIEVKHYRAMHELKAGRFAAAAPLLETVLAAQPDRLAAIEGLARVRASEGRLAEAAVLLERAAPLARRPEDYLAELGRMRMSTGDTPGAIAAFERARASASGNFGHDLELGVLYLATKRFEEARDALDRVPADSPGYPMALFKRAQVSVLLDEPDAGERIAAARAGADAVTAPLVAAERLFANVAGTGVR